MYWYDHDMGGWGYAGMWFGMLLFWGLVIAGIVLAVRFAVVGTERNPQFRPEQSSPERILAERFAAGDIDKDEYASRLAALREHGTGEGRR